MAMWGGRWCEAQEAQEAVELVGERESWEVEAKEVCMGALHFDDDSESGIWIERRLLCGAKREERDFGLGLALDSRRYIG